MSKQIEMLKKAWSGLNWPQVVFLIALIAGVVISLREVPSDFWARVDWKWWAGFLLAAGGAGGSAMVDKLTKGDEK